MQDNDYKKPIGALWLKQKPDGEQYFFGEFTESNGVKVNVVVFVNGFKESEKHPDYKIYHSKPRTENPQQVAKTSQSPELMADGQPFPSDADEPAPAPERYASVPPAFRPQAEDLPQ